ncbi:SEC-C domain-containing protein [Salipaludibacillus sp. HK11]|uniref:SEC-C domain-containing protein n=1 Tax=Salipaludibacillus sp. HK11 TaxID=3394320 RepID=UPI0039FD9137
MAILKRNEPCLCGSGKKYKKCCLNKIQTKQNFDLSDQRAYNELLPKLFDYSKEFDYQIQPIYEKYVASFDRLSKADAQAFSQLLFHWMIFNYPVNEESETILVNYIKQQGPMYSEKFQQFLQEWNDLQPRIFRITASDNKQIIVYDIFHDQSITIEKTPASANLNEGDRIIGYLYPTPTGHSLGNDAIAIPEKLEEAFLAHWNNMKKITERRFATDIKSEQDWFSDHFHDALDVLGLMFVSGKDLLAEDKLSEPSKHVLQILSEKIELEPSNYTSFMNAKIRWISYTLKHAPRIQKPEAFAAALEYWVSKQASNSHISQKKLAEKYHVSVSTISNKYKDINDF